MDAVKMMGKAVKMSAELTKDRDCIGAAKLVTLCNAPRTILYGRCVSRCGEPDCVINVGVSGPGVVKCALEKAGDCSVDRLPTL